MVRVTWNTYARTVLPWTEKSIDHKGVCCGFAYCRDGTRCIVVEDGDVKFQEIPIEHCVMDRTTIKSYGEK